MQTFFLRFAAGLCLVTVISQAQFNGNPRGETSYYGSSGGNVRDFTRRYCCSGTLGALVQDGSQNRYILSNNHVIGLSGAAQVGDDISQPGLIDSNCQVRRVVADFTVAPSLTANVDAAIAQLRSGAMSADGEILNIGPIGSTVQPAFVGLQVQKNGRTTGYTTGSISSVSTTVSVRYPSSCGSNRGPSYTFRNQIVINSSTFSAGGDSGSLILSQGSGCPLPVALLFAGSSTATIGNPIQEVLTATGQGLGRPLSFVGTCTDTRVTSAGTVQTVVPSDVQTDNARRVKEDNERDWLSRPGVVGVGVGQADDNAAEAVIVIYVDRGAGRQPELPEQARGVRIKRVLTDPFVAIGDCCKGCQDTAKRGVKRRVK